MLSEIRLEPRKAVRRSQEVDGWSLVFKTKGESVFDAKREACLPVSDKLPREMHAEVAESSRWCVPSWGLFQRDVLWAKISSRFATATV